MFKLVLVLWLLAFSLHERNANVSDASLIDGGTHVHDAVVYSRFASFLLRF